MSDKLDPIEMAPANIMTLEEHELPKLRLLLPSGSLFSGDASEGSMTAIYAEYRRLFITWRIGALLPLERLGASLVATDDAELSWNAPKRTKFNGRDAITRTGIVSGVRLQETEVQCGNRVVHLHATDLGALPDAILASLHCDDVTPPPLTLPLTSEQNSDLVGWRVGRLMPHETIATKPGVTIYAVTFTGAINALDKLVSGFVPANKVTHTPKFVVDALAHHGLVWTRLPDAAQSERALHIDLGSLVYRGSTRAAGHGYYRCPGTDVFVVVATDRKHKPLIHDLLERFDCAGADAPRLFNDVHALPADEPYFR